MSGIEVQDHVHVTIGEGSVLLTLEHMSAVNEDATFQEIREFVLV